MKTDILVLIICVIVYAVSGFKVDHYDESYEPANADELVFLFQMTRHGARSPYMSISEPNITTEWRQGLGQLTNNGERQHYLLAKKHRAKYGDYFSGQFDPNEIYIVATDVNRTIMSAYSELMSWYPLGSVKQIKNKERDIAIPPFKYDDPYKILSKLGDNPTMYGYQPVPIHVSQGIDEMLRAMDAPVCPCVKKFEKMAKSEEAFKQTNEKYKDNVIKDIKEKWNIEGDLDFIDIKAYTDTYYAAYFDQRPIDDQYKLDVEKLDTLLADQFYNYTFFYDEMVRIASTKFLNYLYTMMDAKINSTFSDDSAFDWIRKKKLIYFSAHDSTVAAMMAGIEQKQPLQPFYAIPILVELWKKSGASGTTPDDYYVRWIYNGNFTNINGTCEGDDAKCSYPQFKEYLQSREYQGDWDSACHEGETWMARNGKWYIVAGTAGGVLLIGVIGYFVIKRIILAPKEE